MSLRVDEPPPPPSPALRALVDKSAPVRTRVPARTLAVVSALAVACTGIAFYVHPLRPDLADQPRLRFTLVGLTWLAAFVVSLSAALLPPPRQVLPDAARAGRSALLAALAVLLACAIGTVTVATSLVPIDFWSRARDCMAFEGKVFLATALLGLVALWRIRPAGSWRIGAAVGAAGGSLGGLALHLLCPYSTTAHVLVSHAGPVALCALVGAAFSALVLRR